MCRKIFSTQKVWKSSARSQTVKSCITNVDRWISIHRLVAKTRERFKGLSNWLTHIQGPSDDYSRSSAKIAFDVHTRETRWVSSVDSTRTRDRMCGEYTSFWWWGGRWIIDWPPLESLRPQEALKNRNRRVAMRYLGETRWFTGDPSFERSSDCLCCRSSRISNFRLFVFLFFFLFLFLFVRSLFYFAWLSFEMKGGLPRGNSIDRNLLFLTSSSHSFDYLEFFRSFHSTYRIQFAWSALQMVQLHFF